MKKINTVLITVVLFAACKKNSSSSYTPNCSGAAKSYATDVAPLINSGCVGCHSSYSSYAGVSGSKDNIRSNIVSGNMPKNSTWSDDQRNTVVCWIDAGAQNN